MIKWVIVYKSRYCDEINYRVLHESNRLYEYYEKAPKTVENFIKNSTQVERYTDRLFNEKGYIFWA